MTFLNQSQRYRYTVPHLRRMSRHSRHRPQPSHPCRTRPTRNPPRRRPNLQCYRHCPRFRHNLLYSNTCNDRRLRKLTGPPYNRRPRYSFPPNKQHKLLTSPSLISSLTRIIYSRSRSRNRMNCLPPISWQPRPCWCLRRPGHLLSPPSRGLLYSRGHQLHHYCNQYKTPSPLTVSNTFICVICPNYSHPTALISSSPRRRYHYASYRSEPQHHIL